MARRVEDDEEKTLSRAWATFFLCVCAKPYCRSGIQITCGDFSSHLDEEEESGRAVDRRSEQRRRGGRSGCTTLSCNSFFSLFFLSSFCSLKRNPPSLPSSLS